jgi:hypothetical protein
MSEPLIPNMPEVPLPPSASNVVINPDDTDPDGIQGLLSSLATIKPEEPDVAETQRPEHLQNNLLYNAERELINQAVSDPSLVHSSTVVFEQLRYYDAVRLRMYAQRSYDDLVRLIKTTPQVPMVVKENLPPFNYLAFPMTINPNWITSEITVSVNHNEPNVSISFILKFSNGPQQMYLSAFSYRK